MSIEELNEKIYDVGIKCSFSTKTNKEKGIIVIECDENYFPNDREDLSQAWEDFKEVNATLKKAGIKTSFDDNTPPDYDWPEWEIIVKVDEN